MGLYAQSKSIQLDGGIINNCSMYVSGITQQITTPIAQFSFNSSGTIAYNETSSISGTFLSGTFVSSGKLGSCISLAGSPYNSYVNISGLYNTYNSGAGTIAMWVNRNVDQDIGLFFYAGISMGDGWGDNDEIQIGRRNDIGSISYQIFQSGTTRVSINKNVNVDNPGNWYHVAATWNGSNAWAYLYCNGSIIGSSLQTQNIALTNYNIWMIGGCTATAIRCLAGKIDDFRIYNQSLNQSDIKAIYNEGVGTETINPPTQSGLSYYITSNNSNYDQLPSTGSGMRVITIPGSDLKWRITCGSSATASIGYIQLDY